MIYTVKKVIKSEMSDDAFIALCKKSFRKTVIICSLLVALELMMFLGLCFCGHFQLSAAMPFFEGACLIFFIPFFFSFMILFGNAVSRGIIYERKQCREMKGWARFAERNVLTPKGAILSKRLEAEGKEPLDVCLDSKELRCKNTETGEPEVFPLSDRYMFRELFAIKRNPDLAKGEIILDLSSDELVAYIGARGEQCCGL